MKNLFDKIKKRALYLQKKICALIAIIVLFIEYIFIVIPISFFMKLTGRDRLLLKKPDKNSYWLSNVSLDADYERQF